MLRPASMALWLSHGLVVSGFESLSGILSHCAMGVRINTLWWTHITISRTNRCSTIGVTKVLYVLFGLWGGAYKRILAANCIE